MKKIVTIGGAMRDMYLENTDTQAMYLETDTKKQAFIMLQEGRKIDVSTIHYHTGGGAINSAVSFLKLGHSVKSFFKVGADTEGAYIHAQLQQKGVIVSPIISHVPSERTGSSIIIPCHSGDRAVFVHRGANLSFTFQEIHLDLITACDQLYITSLSNHASNMLPLLVAHANKHTIPVAINPGTSQLTANASNLEAALPGIAIFILNSYEATLFMNTSIQNSFQKPYLYTNHADLPELLKKPLGQQTICFSLAQFFIEMIRRGPRIIVVTNGAEGVYACDGHTIYFHPSIPSDIISTLGAGDAFGSTFVSYIIQNRSITDAIRAGMINATSVLSAIGTQTGLLTHEQLEKRLKNLSPSLLQTFPLII